MKKILFVSALWCPACLLMRPRYQTFSLENPGWIFAEIDYDEEPTFVKEKRIGRMLPVAIILVDNREITRVVGEVSLKKIKETLSLL